jgi:hypothetical protein
MIGLGSVDGIKTINIHLDLAVFGRTELMVTGIFTSTTIPSTACWLLCDHGQGQGFVISTLPDTGNIGKTGCHDGLCRGCPLTPRRTILEPSINRWLLLHQKPPPESNLPANGGPDFHFASLHRFGCVDHLDSGNLYHGRQKCNDRVLAVGSVDRVVRPSRL